MALDSSEYGTHWFQAQNSFARRKIPLREKIFSEFPGDTGIGRVEEMRKVHLERRTQMCRQQGHGRAQVANEGSDLRSDVVMVPLQIGLDLLRRALLQLAKQAGPFCVERFAAARCFCGFVDFHQAAPDEKRVFS